MIDVDGSSSRRNKDAFSNFSGVVRMLLNTFSDTELIQSLASSSAMSSEKRFFVFLFCVLDVLDVLGVLGVPDVLVRLSRQSRRPISSVTAVV